MASKAHNYNVIEMLKQRLQHDITETLTGKLVEDAVEEFRKTIEPVIKAGVEPLVVGACERTQNVAMMRDDYTVWLKWNDEDEKELVARDCGTCKKYQPGIMCSDCSGDINNYPGWQAK